MELQEFVDKYHRRTLEIEALRHELHCAEQKAERIMQILLDIHALLYPPRVTLDDGRMFEFRSPIVEEQMQALSDRIRAIPDELERIREWDVERGMQ